MLNAMADNGSNKNKAKLGQFGSFLVAFCLVGLLAVMAHGNASDTDATATMPLQPSSPQRRRALQSTDRSTNALRVKFQQAKAKYFEQLKIDYGTEYFDNFLMRHPDGQRDQAAAKTIMHGWGISWDKMVQRMMKKILTHQISGETVNFIWSTGGHSASAGHGNFYNESYTAVMERNSKDFMAAVGLDFTGRNYAMGGTSSAMEVGSCSKEIFGTDIDVLSWDFGMTDGRDNQLLVYYFYRAILSKSRPVCVGLDLGGRGNRAGALVQIQDLGAPVFFKIDKEMEKMYNGIPDTSGKNAEQISVMPKFVRSFRCGNQQEKGDPTCGASKWTKSPIAKCEARKFRTSWHPGWKWHALNGNILAMFLMEVVEHALDAIEESEATKNPAVLLKELQDLEDAVYANITTLPLPPISRQLKVANVSTNMLYRKPNFCHTARLPAEIRHLGILTESEKKGMYTFDMGTQDDVAAITQNPGGVMRLTYGWGSRQACAPEVGMDYKDYFYAHQIHQGKTSIELPNEAEIMEYGNQPLLGYISVCFAACSWGRCPKGSVNAAEFREGQATMEVNGEPVTGLIDMRDCYFLTGARGPKWDPNSNGKFEISVDVTAPGGYMRFSSFIIW